MSCTSGKNTITWFRGQAKSIRLTLCFPPAEGIAGWTFAFYLYDGITDDATLLLTKTTGFTITDAGGGGNEAIVELLLDAVDTSGLTPGTLFHKWVRATNGVVLDYGPFLLQP